MATLPYVRYDPGTNQLSAGPNLAGNAGVYPYLRGLAATSGAETVAVLAKDLPEGGVLWFSAQALAKTPGGAEVATLSQTGRISRSGPVVAVYVDSGAMAAPPALDGLALAVVPADAAAAVQVSGVAGAEVAWRVTFVYDEW